MYHSLLDDDRQTMIVNFSDAAESGKRDETVQNKKQFLNTSQF